jgi:radical SAM superfamily enzyme YgiQ (UPF0313 family)
VKILLIQPEWNTGGIGFRLAAMPEPLHLEILAATVADHDCRILDMRLDADLWGMLQRFTPDVVAVTALTTEVYAARDVLRAVREFSPDIFTVIGGHHCTLMPEDFFLPKVDAIALGEGEAVFPELIDALEQNNSLADVPNLIWQGKDGGFVRNSRTRPAIDMNRVPLPRRDLVADYADEYFFLFDKPDASVATGRGCPYRCNFCSVHEFYQGRTCQMSAQRVLDEIRHVPNHHITFVDDNFLMNHRREKTIAELIAAEGIEKRFSMECRTDSIVRHPELVEQWVGQGLYAVLLGLEGASDDSLTNVNKANEIATNDEAIRILQANGVIIWGAFIVDPQWTAEDFERLRDYVNAREITHTQFTVLTPLVGTDLYRRRYNELLTHDYRCYDTLHAVTPTRLPREEFYQRFANLYKQVDLGPYYDLVSEGKLTVADVRRGKQMLDAMSQWESYLPLDPVVGDLDNAPEVHVHTPSDDAIRSTA